MNIWNVIARSYRNTRAMGAAIAMRGYKAPPGEMSDEEAEYRERFGESPAETLRKR